MQFHQEREKILVIDFGSQVTKLIGRNIRELGVYSEIITPKDFKIKEFQTYKRNNFFRGPIFCNFRNIKQYQKRFLKKIYQFWEFVTVYNL